MSKDMAATASVMAIAIDGPAAAGKGTLAQQLAAHYGFAYLDTGALYRAVGFGVLEAGGAPDDPAAALAAARALDPERRFDPALRTDAVGLAALQVAAQAPVRNEILDFQRRFVASPPGGAAAAVLDGRDIGTVVCPQARFKFYVTAPLKVRAQRRWQELVAQGQKAHKAQVLEQMRSRDRHDMSRATAPLRRAAGAHLINTAAMNTRAVFDTAVRIIDSVPGGGAP